MRDPPEGETSPVCQRTTEVVRRVASAREVRAEPIGGVESPPQRRETMRKSFLSAAGCALILAVVGAAGAGGGAAARHQKPGLQAKRRLAITRTPVAATARAGRLKPGEN